MGLMNQEVEVVLHPSNTKHYEKLGYEIPRYKNKQGREVVKKGTKIKVRASDLTNKSRVMVDVECDGCGKMLSVRWYSYAKCVRKDGTYFCHLCTCSKYGKFTPIAESHPHLIEYFENSNDTLRYSCCSNKKVDMKCPDCGFKKKMAINNLTNQGFSCPVCSDGISYPNKFMAKLLSLLDVKYESEKAFDWCEFVFKGKLRRGRYDFYFEYKDKKCIVEMDGIWHFEDNDRSGQTKEESVCIDKVKDKLALAHGISVIRIDAVKSELEYIKNSIMESKLNEMFDLINIDWNICEEGARSSKVKKACELWAKGDGNTKVIAEKLNISITTVIKYLKIGTSLGWCDYDPREVLDSMGFLPRKVVCVNGGMVFNSIADAVKWANLSSGSNIIKCCKGKRRSSGKHPETGERLRWMYKEDYDKYIERSKLKYAI